MNVHEHPLHQPLRGFFALVRARRHRLWVFPLAFGLLPGLVCGVALRIQGAPDLYLRANVGLLLLSAPLWLAILAPILACLDFSTLGRAAGSPDRRMELLALPVGRLALPLSRLCVSVVLFALWNGALVAGLSLMIGAEELRALQELATGMHPRATAGFEFTLCVFFGVWATVTIGNDPADIFCLWFLAPLAICASLPLMGYARDEVEAYSLCWVWSLSLYALALPFFLSAQSPACWAKVSGGWQHRRNAHWIAFFTSIFALVILGLVGWCWQLAAVIAIGATATWRIGRLAAREEHGSEQLLWRAHALALATALPPLILGLVIDAQLVASVRPDGDVQVWPVVESPDGRRVAAEIAPQSHRSVSDVIVLDLHGQESVVQLHLRFGRIQGWSKDGRYLAVLDDGIGRVGLRTGEVGAIKPADAGIWHSLFAPRTVIHDTQTGAISRLSARWVAPGWSSPEELVGLESGGYFDAYLVDGRGRRASLAFAANSLVEVIAYEDGIPVVAVAGGRDSRWHEQFGEFTGELWRWTPDGLEPDAVAASESWQVHWPDRPPHSQPRRFTMTRGDARIEVDAPRSCWLLLAPDPCLAFNDAQGLWRVRLPGGERELLLADANAVAGRDPCFAFSGKQSNLVGIKAGSVQLLPQSRLYPVQALSAGRILLADRDNSTWLRETDGTEHLLLGR